MGPIYWGQGGSIAPKTAPRSEERAENDSSERRILGANERAVKMLLARLSERRASGGRDLASVRILPLNGEGAASERSAN